MPGIKALRRVQIGPELSPGATTDVATTIWRGMGVIKDNLEITFVEEDIGILGGANRTYKGKTGGEIELSGTATFEQLPYGFQSGIYATTPTTDTSSGLTWTWNVQSLSTDPIATSDLQTYVIEGGDNQQAENMHYCFTKELKLSGEAGAAIDLSMTLEGRDVAPTTFTAGLSIPSVEDILFSKGLLYIDQTSDAAGSTLKSNTLLKMDLTYTTGWVPVFAADGNTYFSFVKRQSDAITLDITFEHDGTSVAEKSAWRAQTERVIRLKFAGNALTTTDAGATYDTKILLIDLYGKWESFDALSDMDGNDTVVGKFKVGYSATAAKKCVFTVVNELSSLP